MEWILVDVQGFKDNTNRFIVKEISVETKNLQFHDIIKSPAIVQKNLDKKHRRESKWLTENYHGFSWEDGYITLNELRQTLYPIFNNNNAQIFVKGEEKTKWIKAIMGNDELKCKNVENEDFNVLPEEKAKCWACFKHKHITDTSKIHCALENVKVLKKWFMRHKSSNKSEQNCTD